MKILLLRGQVPRDRDPKEIIFEKIEDCDDVWTQLVFHMLSENDLGEVWYWGGKRKYQFTKQFIERWIPDFNHYQSQFNPDVIFCRGGFSEYHSVLNRYPNAFKIYYGAGRRFLPQPGFSNYNLILQDSQEQLNICQNKYPNIKSSLFIKPAADNIFYPKEVEKIYDVCFPANGSQENIKGHKFVFQTAPKELKILNLGNNTRKTEYPRNVRRKRVLKSQMAEEYSRCKVGIVCCSGKVDSCPRVIPEMLACGLPIVVLNEVRFWKEKYITEQTGVISNKDNFWNNVREVLQNYQNIDTKVYYKKNLSLEKSANFIKNMIC